MGGAWDREGGPWSRGGESAGSQEGGDAWAGHLEPGGRRDNDAWREFGFQEIQESSVGATEHDDSWQKSNDGSGKDLFKRAACPIFWVCPLEGPWLRR